MQQQQQQQQQQQLAFVSVYNDDPRDLLVRRIVDLDFFYSCVSRSSDPRRFRRLRPHRLDREVQNPAFPVERGGAAAAAAAAAMLNQIHVVRIEMGPCGEMFAVLKTCWIARIQRAWKERFRWRKEVIEGRKRISSLRTFERTGKYDAGLGYLPTIHGLLAGLKNGFFSLK